MSSCLPLDLEPQIIKTNYGTIYFGEAYIDSLKTPELIAELDSIQYLGDVMILNNKTYVTGYKFTGPNSRFSQIVCINNSNNQIDWKKTIDHYEVVQLGRISKIDDYLYITGSGGKHGVEKDSSGAVVANHIDLNAIIVRFKPNGDEFKIKEIENDNASISISPLIKHNNALYISYSIVNNKDQGLITRKENKLFELDKNLNPIREKVYSNQQLNGINLFSLNGHLYVIGSESDGSKQFISYYSFSDKLSSSKNILSENKYEYQYAVQKYDNDIRITAYGNKKDKETSNEYDRKSQVISTYSLFHDHWNTKHLFEFNSDSAFHLPKYYPPLSSNRHGVYSIGVQNNKEQFICKIENTGVMILDKFQVPKHSKIKMLIVEQDNIFLAVSKEHGWSNRSKDKILIYTIP